MHLSSETTVALKHKQWLSLGRRMTNTFSYLVLKIMNMNYFCNKETKLAIIPVTSA